MPAVPFETLRPAAGEESATLAHRPKHAPVTNGIASSKWTNTEFTSPDGSTQDALLLHAAGEYYKLTEGHEIPQPKNDAELLVQIISIGLNPVDWKGADFGFGQPDYPWVNGRDFSGIVVTAAKDTASRIREGDLVFGCSTDYRDIRKASFQEYLVANHWNVSRIPDGVTVNEVAAVGTALIAAVVGLGICFGIDFSQLKKDNVPQGPDILTEARINRQNLPKDTHDEVMTAITGDALPRPGSFVVIWGGGWAGQAFGQLAKLAGLKVVCIDDLVLVGDKLAELGFDLLLDYKAYEDQPQRLIDVIHGVTGGRVRFGVDTVGKKTAEQLQKVLQPSHSGLEAHLVGLSGLPEGKKRGVVHHMLPLKLFHTLPEFGESISTWLEELVLSKNLVLPTVELADGGLSGINDALDRLRRNEVPGKRIVSPLRTRE